MAGLELPEILGKPIEKTPEAQNLMKLRETLPIKM